MAVHCAEWFGISFAKEKEKGAYELVYLGATSEKKADVSLLGLGLHDWLSIFH